MGHADEKGDSGNLIHPEDEGEQDREASHPSHPREQTDDEADSGTGQQPGESFRLQYCEKRFYRGVTP